MKINCLKCVIILRPSIPRSPGEVLSTPNQDVDFLGFLTNKKIRQ